MKTILGIAGAVLLLLPIVVFAAYVSEPFPTPNTGVAPRTIPQIIAGVINILHALAVAVTTATFLIGGISVVASAGRENVVQTGKSIMKSSLIGLAIILGSWLILSTFISFLRPAA